MDGKDLKQIRSVLLDRWKKFEAAQGRRFETHGETFGAQAEIIDIAQALEQMGRDTSIKEAERRELVAIERALTKMATGSFGVCEECGEEIPPRRLMVLPEARLCANCQAFEERQNSRLRHAGAVAR